ncbi:MAG: hypothetical protein ACKVU0_03485 [Saprospiraceae bacterium]
MKKPFKFLKAISLALAVFFGFSGIAELNAQTPISKAKYDKTTKVLSLDETAAFGYLFQLDIGPMGLASKEKAEEFFNNWNTELVTFRVNFEKQSTSVILNLRSKPTWKARDWNNYLSQLPKQ